jgi:23S rRNA (uracil1939-C5)-methyltransferase
METCRYFGKCGGCQTPNLTYEEQLRMKMGRVIALLGRFGHVEEIVGMDDPLHYRTKVQAAFVRRGEGMLCGLYQSGSGRVIPAQHCLLEDEYALSIRRAAEKAARTLKLTVYSPDNGRGLLRHMLIRVSRATGQAMLVLVTGIAPFARAEEFVRMMREACPRLTTVVRCVNDTKIPLWLGGQTEVLYGPGSIEERIGGCTFTVSPRAFLQVNPVQTEKLYAIALEDAALSGRETVVDAYCGVGTLGILAARRSREVIGIEVNEDAAADAGANAAKNGVTNARFLAGDAGECLARLAGERRRADVVLLDPPRAGCSREALRALIALAPQRIVYVSCDVETLARDLRTLTRGGYRAERISPVDMFPYTTHTECAVKLVRQ